MFRELTTANGSILRVVQRNPSATRIRFEHTSSSTNLFKEIIMHSSSWEFLCPLLGSSCHSICFYVSVWHILVLLCLLMPFQAMTIKILKKVTWNINRTFRNSLCTVSLIAASLSVFSGKSFLPLLHWTKPETIRGLSPALTKGQPPTIIPLLI